MLAFRSFRYTLLYATDTVFANTERYDIATTRSTDLFPQTFSTYAVCLPGDTGQRASYTVAIEFISKSRFGGNRGVVDTRLYAGRQCADHSASFLL